VRGVTVPPGDMPSDFIMDLILNKCPEMPLRISTFVSNTKRGCCMGELSALNTCTWAGNFSSPGVMDCPCPTDEQRLARTAEKVSRRQSG
jgi:hypothetical protein